MNKPEAFARMAETVEIGQLCVYDRANNVMYAYRPDGNYGGGTGPVNVVDDPTGQYSVAHSKKNVDGMIYETDTMRDMCEIIAESKLLLNKDGTHPTAVEVFNYSPTGELSRIWEWYEIARLLLNARDEYEKEKEPEPPRRKTFDIVELRNQVCEAIGWAKADPVTWGDNMYRDSLCQEWSTDGGCQNVFHPDQRPEQLAMACVLADVPFFYDRKGLAVDLRGFEGDHACVSYDPIEIMRYIVERESK